MTIRRIGGWIGAGLADAAGRLVILSATTAFLARTLPPGDFGATALTLSIVTAFSMAVGTPYEEALTQAKVVRRADLGAVLAVSTAAAFGFLALCVPVGLLLDHVYGRDDLGLLLPATGLLLIAQGPMTLATAVARRRKAFYIINASSIIGHLFGAAAAIALGFAGAGIWALVTLRIVLVFTSAASLFWMLGLAVRPVWSWGRLRRFNRFAGLVLAARVVENATYVVYNTLVGALFGLTVLGYLNIAMRLIEPVRGAIVAVTHNLCFPHFRGSAQSKENVGEAAAEIARESSALVAPTMMGLAAVSPLVVPLMAGPGWTTAEPIAAALAAGGLLALPSQVVQTALSASGRPQSVLLSYTVALVTLAATLVATAGMHPATIGLARLAGDFALTATTVLVNGPLIGLSPWPLLRRLSGVWLAAATMAVIVAWLGIRLADSHGQVVALLIAIPAGVLIYIPLLFLISRASFNSLVDRIRPLIGRAALADAR
ncbi:oligosaccharide flippase family protein [Methylobacterium sp. J-076]|uniref:oligosaccharide flippase family protein n=1 Tax=Methylobacterium sp. J-076 TaxID=2836655 RepID=UPI001FB9ABC6|nr:oligosaccharide flippase family protein [Methylobacterium sp. J-076]MCJ2013387.1 oligosaccharide flippase family protein [Methylobacterium sp. J-076]